MIIVILELQGDLLNTRIYLGETPSIIRKMPLNLLARMLIFDNLELDYSPDIQLSKKMNQKT
jgi:hypothetical protein